MSIFQYPVQLIRVNHIIFSNFSFQIFDKSLIIFSPKLHFLHNIYMLKNNFLILLFVIKIFSEIFSSNFIFYFFFAYSFFPYFFSRLSTFSVNFWTIFFHILSDFFATWFFIHDYFFYIFSGISEIIRRLPSYALCICPLGMSCRYFCGNILCF